MSTLWLSKAWPKTALLPSGVLARVAPQVARATGWAIVPMRVVAARPVTALLFAGLCHRLFPWCFWGLLGATVAVVALDTLTARGQGVSSLAHAVKSAYWRFYLMFRWDRLCKSACVEEVLKTEHGQVLNRPRLKFRYPWQLWHWRYRIRQTPNGLSCVVDGTTVGRPSEGFEGAPALSFGNTMCAKQLIVTQHSRRPSLTRFDFIYRDPFKYPVTDLPLQRKLGIVSIGRDSQRDIVTLNMLMHHLLIGVSRSGKSSTVWTMLKGLLDQQVNFLLWCIDPKGGVEFFNLEGRAFVYEDNLLRSKNFVEQALAALALRQSEMKAAGVREWKPGDDRWPLQVIVIDELITFLKTLKKQKITINGEQVAAEDAMAFLLTQGLGVGFMCIGCSQAGQKELIGVIRDLFSSITCFRMASDEMVRACGFDPKVHPAHNIQFGPAFAGQAYMRTEEGHVTHFRAGWCPDEERERITQEIHKLSQKYWTQKQRLENVELNFEKEEVAA
jgi:hypothetical protein